MSGLSGDRRSAPKNAFLAWFNRLPIFEQELGRNGPGITFANLSDGQKLWRALQELNPTSFSGGLPEPVTQSGKMVANLQNLKKIHRSLQNYILETQGKPLSRADNQIDLKAIAEGSNHGETAKLLKLVFAAAMTSEGNEGFIAAIMPLPEEEQKTLQAAVLEFSQYSPADDQDEEEEDQPQPSPRKVPVDSDLYHEELYGKLASENTKLEREKKDLQKDMKDLSSRLTRLQEHNGVLLEDLRAAQDAAKQASSSVSDGIRVKELETKLRTQEDHIANQEGQLNDYDSRHIGLTAELNKLRKAQDKLQPLQDTVDELRVDRDNLARRNNALERYKLKVQDAQDVENENKSLRRELEESKNLSQEGDGVRQHNISLQREVSELKSLMANTEIQLVEAQQRRRQIELENSHFREKLEESIEQRERDQETISNLTGGSPQLGIDAAQPVSFGEELEASEKHDTELNQDLKSKNDQLTKVTNDASARSIALQQLLDEEKDKQAKLHERYLESYQKNLALENIIKDSSSDESKKFYREMEEKLDAEQQKAKALAEERSAIDSKLAEAEKIISLVNENELGALEKLKGFNSSESRDKGAQVITLQARVKDLEGQLDEHRNMLSKSLGSQGGHTPESDSRFADLIKTIEEGRESLTKHKQDLELKEHEIEQLKGNLQKLTEKAAPGLLKAAEQAALKQELANTRRENRLMTTAFYDLSSRLQMNNVSLQRRSEAPRAFLNRQRQLVNKATAVQTR